MPARRPPPARDGGTIAPIPKVLAPIVALRGVVLCCWALDGMDAEPKQDVPDGCIDLLFSFGDRVEATVVGVATRARLASRPARCVLGVTLAPGEALPIIDVPVHELRDRSVPLDELWPGARMLIDQMATQGTAEARADVLQRALAGRLVHSPLPASDRIRYSLRRLSETSGQLRIAALARSVGVSERQLERLFRERTGLGPKEMARVARLRTLLAHLSSEERADWADIAAAFGYADQAHLIHEFQTLTGKSPQRYFDDADASSRQVDASGFYPVGGHP
jgi:methylphosphotriester-DNA--protein-cysteine methyltransferase